MGTLNLKALISFEILTDKYLSKVRGGRADDISVNLKMLRVTKGVTQREVACAVHVAPTEISMYEHGKRLPSPDVMIDLSDYFNVSIDSIMRH